ncbi:ABC transporter substrate-binding protein [Anaerococcus sp. Marseille-P9784]|uniref:ABC transporter substrate-binding protein n=1 Tax=Anaerococcus sp. Marseille-P9784 TaxID=2614127 RepID=UPI00124A083D|nr:ABC transporter substrate-binding protein [Anaerococcus sp. Marseille-P9784]
MKMKKVFSSLMALGLATTLVACGGNTDKDAEKPADNANEATDTENKDDASTDENADTEDNADDKTDDKESDENADDEDAEAKEELENFEKQTADDTLVIGTSELNGDWLQGWTNSAYDVKVRRLLGIEGNNGYGTVVQDEGGQWVTNSTVVDGEIEKIDNEDGSRTYRTKIKQGLKYSDGVEIKADDFLFGNLLFSHPSYIPVTAATTIGADSAKGYEAYHNGDTDIFEGQKKIDDYTFEYTVDASFLPYFEEASLMGLSPFPMHEVTENLVVSKDGQKLETKEGYEVTEEDKKNYKDSLQQQIDKQNEDFEADYPAPKDDASEDEKAEYNAAKEEHDAAIKKLEDKRDGEVDPTILLIEQAMLNVANNYRTNPKAVTGPYVYDGFENNMVKLSLNPEYAGNFKGDKATIPHIIVQTVNANIAVDLLENGDIDIWEEEADGGKIDQMRAATDAGKIKYNTFERNGYGDLSFITDRGATQYKEVRQAIASLMDRNTFVQQFAGGYGVVTNGMYGTSQWMYKERGADLETGDKLVNWQLNLDKANELLDKTPYKFEADGKTPWDKKKSDEAFEKDAEGYNYWRYDETGKQLVVNQYGSDESPITTLISNQLPVNAKQVGMEYNVTAGSFATLLEYYTTPKEDAEYTAFNMGLSFGTPYDPYYQYNSKGFDNKTKTNDPKADEITEKLRKTDPEDKEGYLDTWEEFQIWYNDYLPEIPLYSNQYHTGYTNRVQGFDLCTPVWGVVEQINAMSLGK